MRSKGGWQTRSHTTRAGEGGGDTGCLGGGCLKGERLRPLSLAGRPGEVLRLESPLSPTSCMEVSNWTTYKLH